MSKKAVSIEVIYGKGRIEGHFPLPLTAEAKKMLVDRINSGKFKKIKIKTNYED